MQASGAVDLLRHDDPFPGHHIFWRGGHHQRSGAVSQVWMRSEECLDPARTGHTETVDGDPPTSAPGNSKREVGKGLDTCIPEHRGDAWLEPEIDAVADQRGWNGGRAQLLDGGGHGASGHGTLAGGPGEELGKVTAVARSGEGRDVSADRPDEAARGLANCPGFAKVPSDRLARRQALVPGPQRGQRGNVGERWWVRGYRR